MKVRSSNYECIGTDPRSVRLVRCSDIRSDLRVARLLAKVHAAMSIKWTTQPSECIAAMRSE